MWSTIARTKIPKMITIGETFLLRRYIQRKVKPRAARPGINWFKLSCNVVTLLASSDLPAACSRKAALTPAIPFGSLSQSI